MTQCRDCHAATAMPGRSWHVPKQLRMHMLSGHRLFDAHAGSVKVVTRSLLYKEMMKSDRPKDTGQDQHAYIDFTVMFASKCHCSPHPVCS